MSSSTYSNLTMQWVCITTNLMDFEMNKRHLILNLFNSLKINFEKTTNSSSLKKLPFTTPTLTFKQIGMKCRDRARQLDKHEMKRLALLGANVSVRIHDRKGYINKPLD